MKWASIIQMVVINVILLPLLVLVSENYASRNAYFKGEGFTYTMTRYPFFYITSAVKGSTQIQGLLTVDWQQIILAILVVTDAYYAWSMTRTQRRAASPLP